MNTHCCRPEWVETLRRRRRRAYYGIVMATSPQWLFTRMPCAAIGGMQWLQRPARRKFAAVQAAGRGRACSQVVRDPRAVCAGKCGPGNLHPINGLFDLPTAPASRVPVVPRSRVSTFLRPEDRSGYFFQERHPEQLFSGKCSSYLRTCFANSSNRCPAQLLKIAVRTKNGGLRSNPTEQLCQRHRHPLPGRTWALKSQRRKNVSARRADWGLGPAAVDLSSVPCPPNQERFESLADPSLNKPAHGPGASRTLHCGSAAKDGAAT